MTIYAIFAEDGSSRGFLPADVFGERVIDGKPNPRIPAEAVEITREQWQELLSTNRKVWDGTKVVERTAPPSQDTLLAYAKQLRWDLEVGGITLGGVAIATDDRSKTLIMGARIRADEDPGVLEDWDTGDTSIVLDAGQIKEISSAVAAHVSRCFTIFRAVKAHILAGRITTIIAIDEAFAALG